MINDRIGRSNGVMAMFSSLRPFKQWCGSWRGRTGSGPQLGV